MGGSLSGVKLIDDKTVKFQVKTVSKDLGTGELFTVYDTCLVTKTGAGWQITELQYG